MDQSLAHLRLLSIFHYIVGGFAALFACFPLIHVALGIALVSGAFPGDPGHPGPPPFVGWFFIGFASFFILLGWSFAVAIILVGRFLARRTHYMYCLIVGGIECLFTPFGTVLGIFTIILLLQPAVKALFEGPFPYVEANASAPHPGGG